MSSSLHPIEQKVLAALRETNSLRLEELVGRTGLQVDQVRRALEWLSTKGYVTLTKSRTSKLEYGGLPPEVRVVQLVQDAPVSLGTLRRNFASDQEFSAALGRAKGRGWIRTETGPDGSTSVKRSSEDALSSLKEIQDLLTHVSGSIPLTDKEGELIPELVKRGFVRKVEQTEVSVTLTPKGLSEAPGAATSGTMDRLTPEILASGAWKGKTLRPLDVESNAPVFYPGRRHPVRDFIKEVREAYISMGFTELQGDSIHPGFWNFDALFIPQDHPSREMQDTFYLDGLSDRKLARTGPVASVAATHEDGWKTGSRGWGYTWRIEEARKLVLRTHNTVLSVRALSESKEKETRVFAVSKVYRNENLDYKHLAEFYQMDGIIVGKGLNVRHLMGFLTEFYKKLGMSKVKLWPTYFPYTEPSLQVIGYSQAVKAWIELSGSGVFRPEVTIPLGVRVPVLAWGPGIERLMLIRYGMDDIRALYGGDLSWLRNRREVAGS
jgi:phenylalanyl-tRNA synthetase alpha chain